MVISEEFNRDCITGTFLETVRFSTRFEAVLSFIVGCLLSGLQDNDNNNNTGKKETLRMIY
jgi:hypothetical protein